MKTLSVVFAVLLVLVQAELWFGKAGMAHVLDMQRQVHAQEAANDEARGRNARIVAEVRDLKEGLEMVEEKARLELGMVRPREILVQVAPGR